MRIKVAERIDTDPYRDRSPEQVEMALRKMGFSRITREQYHKRVQVRLDANVGLG